MSKIISGMRNVQAVLLKSGTAFATRAGGAHRMRPRISAIPEGATFYAALRNSTADALGAPDTFDRASPGLYEASPNNWQIAANNAPRFEQNRLLMEPARTNKCTNHNANPDASLSNVNSGGGDLTRVNNPADIAAAGLQNICSDGNVVQIENNTGGSIFPTIEGATGNTNDHVTSVWINTFGALARFGLTGGIRDVTTSSLERVSFLITPSAGSNAIQFEVFAGEKIQFVLNQLEQSPVVTTPIVTQGASASRAAEFLHYLPAPGFFNEPEGMALATIRFPFDLGPGILNYNAGLVSVSGIGNSVLYCRTEDAINLNLRSYITNTNTGPSAPVNAGDVWHVANRWFGGQFQTLGLSVNGGPWVWDLPYNSPLTWPLNGELGISIDNREGRHLSDVYIYNEDKGQAWIEANYP